MNNGIRVIIKAAFFCIFEFGRGNTMKDSKHDHKEALFMISMLLIPLALSALDEKDDRITILGIIDLHGSVEAGYLLRAGDIISSYSGGSVLSRSYFNYDYKPYVDLGFHLTLFGFIDTGGSIRSVFESLEIVTYRPLLDKYTVFVELKPLDHVRIGFMHYCEHFSVPYSDLFSNEVMRGIDRSEEKVYLRLEF